MIERRHFLRLMLATALAGASAGFRPDAAWAKDGDGGEGEGGGDGGGDGGGGGNSGNGGGGDDGGGDNGGGGGGGNDDGGGDDGGGDDGGGDDGGGDDNGGGRPSSRARTPDDQDEALEGVRSGRIISLEKAIEVVKRKYDGKIIDVKLIRSQGRTVYGMKLRLNAGGRIRQVRVDARTGRLLGLFGL